MTKFARMLDTLDLYSESSTLLTAEDVASRLQVSRPTAFRYVRELTEAGFLANYSGRYSLGARIITLDYRIRESDPVLKASQDIMRSLSAETGCTSILCRMYNEEIIHVHHQPSQDQVRVSFGRGRPLPLFRGAPGKAMLASLPTRRLRRLYDKHRGHPDVKAIARDWPSFKGYFAKIRSVGSYFSNQEVDADILGIAAPFEVQDVGALGVISVVFSLRRFELMNIDGCGAIVRSHAQQLGRVLNEFVRQSERPQTARRASRRSRPGSG
jgi:DNA-binding IclR family transcriptional regulator